MGRQGKRVRVRAEGEEDKKKDEKEDVGEIGEAEEEKNNEQSNEKEDRAEEEDSGRGARLLLRSTARSLFISGSGLFWRIMVLEQPDRLQSLISLARPAWGRCRVCSASKPQGSAHCGEAGALPAAGSHPDTPPHPPPPTGPFMSGDRCTATCAPCLTA